MKSKKVAIVHDWLSEKGGAEVVLKELLHLFPDADIYTMVDIMSKKDRFFLKNNKIFTSSLQKYNFIAKKYKYFFMLMPYLVEQFDLSKYDLVISSSHFVAKGVITNQDQLHIGYIYSPIRYGWDLYHDYDNIGAFGSGLKRVAMKFWLHRMRIWDVVSSKRADYLIADSKFVAKRVKKFWQRDSEVIYPPVDLESTVYSENRDDYYVTMSRLVEYKRVDVIVKAFNEMPNKNLIVIGSGRAENALKKIANKNITFKGYVGRSEAMRLISKAKGFIFMAKEDFGIVPIEAQACGTPVLAYEKGGAKETIEDGITGVFVKEQNEKSLISAIDKFESLSFSPQKCLENAKRFTAQIFKEKIMQFINQKMKEKIYEK